MDNKDNDLVYQVGDLVADPFYSEAKGEVQLGIITQVFEKTYSVEYDIAWQKPTLVQTSRKWDHYEIVRVLKV
jgi:hypothetical protein